MDDVELEAIVAMRLTGFGVVVSAAAVDESEAKFVLLPLIDDDDEVRLD